MSSTKEINASYIKKLNKRFQKVVLDWLNECENQGIIIQIYSGFRTLIEQQKLYDAYTNGTAPYPAAQPGKSYHNYGMAVDVMIMNSPTGDTRDLTMLQKASLLGEAMHVEWGGNFKAKKFAKYNERHHFQLAGYNWQELKTLKDSGKLDDETAVEDNSNAITKNIVTTTVGDDIDTAIYNEKAEQVKETKEEKTTTSSSDKITDVASTFAPGIWQIIKTVIDKEVAGRQINDATIAFDQGSLFSFVQKVCMKPFVEFYGDTYGDQYYLIARKPPFTRSSFLSLYKIYSDIGIEVFEHQVYKETLDWNTGEVYSWYQLIPQGNYIGFENQVFQSMPAVFFEEYATIWGSKPLVTHSNYIQFVKGTGTQENKLIEETAIADMKFLVQINSYLPFTRRGTITIKGDSRYKKGMIFKYRPTNELFYIDSVVQSYAPSEAGPERVTVLHVSRGMYEEYAAREIENENSLSYFNLINFGDYKNAEDKVEQKEIQKDLKIDLSFYFENDIDALIDPTISADDKTKLLDAASPNWRISHQVQNNKNFDTIVKTLFLNKKVKIEITGFIDSDASINNSTLPKRRAITVKNQILSLYKSTYPNDVFDMTRIITKGDLKTPLLETDSVNKALSRKATLKTLPFTIKENKSTTNANETKTGWKVNRVVFDFFIKRKQIFNP